MISSLRVATVWLPLMSVNLLPASQCWNIPESSPTAEIPKADLLSNIMASTVQRFAAGSHWKIYWFSSYSMLETPSININFRSVGEVRWGKPTSHQEDDIVHSDPRGEEERDRQGRGVLPLRLAHSEDLNRIQGRLGLLAGWTIGIILWDSSSHQQELETRWSWHVLCLPPSYLFSILLVGSTGGGHPGLVGGGEELLETSVVISHHTPVGVSGWRCWCSSHSSLARASNEDNTVRVVVSDGAGGTEAEL